jgi:hypothetical protein
MKYIKTFEKFGEIDYNKLWRDIGLNITPGITKNSDLEDEDYEELPLEDSEEDEEKKGNDDSDELPDLLPED